MEYIDSLALLVSVYIVSLVSPGPNFIIVTNTSMTVSRAAGSLRVSDLPSHP
ncbi:hypothetical protein [Rhizobium leguminosarum]|uniref:hypothetical protein n=1 Tax=Rhizobium leguminosarum TaxID=384 RepID=UPI001F25019A|nr:hypothetical protein [Rhizobium leguminosarum]UIJ78121.1 hypothetical protein LZK78_15045 [Rhizobium leguminosarum]